MFSNCISALIQHRELQRKGITSLFWSPGQTRLRTVLWNSLRTAIIKVWTQIPRTNANIFSTSLEKAVCLHKPVQNPDRQHLAALALSRVTDAESSKISFWTWRDAAPCMKMHRLVKTQNLSKSVKGTILQVVIFINIYWWTPLNFILIPCINQIN